MQRPGKKHESGDQEVGGLLLTCFLSCMTFVPVSFVLIYYPHKHLFNSDFPEHTTSSSSSSSSSKRPRLDQIPAVNLDADDPLTDVSVKNHFVL